MRARSAVRSFLLSILKWDKLSHFKFTLLPLRHRARRVQRLPYLLATGNVLHTLTRASQTAGKTKPGAWPGFVQGLRTSGVSAQCSEPVGQMRVMTFAPRCPNIGPPEKHARQNIFAPRWIGGFWWWWGACVP
jgi:hypothetical protein